MKKNKIIIIVLILVFMILCIIFGWLWSSNNSKNKMQNINNKTNITNEQITLTCNRTSIKLNSELICALEGNIKEYEVSAISATIAPSNNYKLISITPNSIWEGDGENGDIDLYTDENKSGNFKIANIAITLTNKNIDNLEIKIENISYFDQEFSEHKIDNITKKIIIEK